MLVKGKNCNLDVATLKLEDEKESGQLFLLCSVRKDRGESLESKYGVVKVLLPEEVTGKFNDVNMDLFNQVSTKGCFDFTDYDKKSFK